MGWMRWDDKTPEHPKMAAAGGDAGWLHFCAVGYCNRNETDGVIPYAAVARLSDRRKPYDLAARLVEVGSWHVHPEGFEIHDYLDYQPSREKLRIDREAAQERMAKSRAKRRGSGNVRVNIDRSSENVRITPDPDPTKYLHELTTQTDPPLSEPVGQSVGPTVEVAAAALIYAAAQVDRDRKAGKEIRRPAAYRDGIARTTVAEQGAALHAHQQAYPNHDPADIAREVLGVQHHELITQGLRTPPPAADPDCGDCAGSGWRSVEEGSTRVEPCSCMASNVTPLRRTS